MPDPRDSNKYFHVDLSGKNTIESDKYLKVVVLDAKNAANQIQDLVEDCSSWDKDVFLKVSNFPDDGTSAPYTNDVVSVIHNIFKSMDGCFDIIINCHHGRNRAIMVTCRLAALIEHGCRGPSREAYQFYQKLCESIYPEYNTEHKETWPKLCNNPFVQEEVFLFHRREGVKYAGLTYGVHIDDPCGSIYVEMRL